MFFNGCHKGFLLAIYMSYVFYVITEQGRLSIMLINARNATYFLS